MIPMIIELLGDRDRQKLREVVLKHKVELGHLGTDIIRRLDAEEERESLMAQRLSRLGRQERALLNQLADGWSILEFCVVPPKTHDIWLIRGNPIMTKTWEKTDRETVRKIQTSRAEFLYIGDAFYSQTSVHLEDGRSDPWAILWSLKREWVALIQSSPTFVSKRSKKK